MHSECDPQSRSLPLGVELSSCVRVSRTASFGQDGWIPRLLANQGIHFRRRASGFARNWQRFRRAVRSPQVDCPELRPPLPGSRPTGRPVNRPSVGGSFTLDNPRRQRRRRRDAGRHLLDAPTTERQPAGREGRIPWAGSHTKWLTRGPGDTMALEPNKRVLA